MRPPLRSSLGAASLLLATLLCLASAATAAGTPACLHTLSSVSGDATSAFTRLADGPALSTDACSTQTSDRLVIVGGFGPLAADGTLQPVNAAFSFHLDTNAWTALAAAPFAGSRCSAANNGTHVFVVGGFEGQAPGTPRSGAHVYSVADDAWSDLPALPVALGGGGLTLAGSQLMYISGENGTGLYSPFVFTLDLSSSTAAWTAVPAALCPEPRADFIALALNATTSSIVVCAGGNVGTETAPLDLPTTLSFTGATGAFGTLAALPEARSHYGAATAAASGAGGCCANSALVAGGRSKATAEANATVLATVAEYSPLEDVWTVIANLPFQWYSPSVALHANATGTFLFVAGGGLDFYFPINLTFVAAVTAACNAPPPPPLPPAPPATIPITAPPAVAAAIAASTASAAGGATVGTGAGTGATSGGPPPPSLGTGAAAAATTGTGAATAGATTAPPPATAAAATATSGTTAPTLPPPTSPITTATTTPTKPPTTAPTTTATTAPTTAPPTKSPTTAPTTAPTTVPPTKPPTTAPTTAPTTPPTMPPTPPPTKATTTTAATTGATTFKINTATVRSELAALRATSTIGKTASLDSTAGIGTIAGKATFTGVTRTTLSPLAVKVSAAPRLASATLLVLTCLILLLGVMVA